MVALLGRRAESSRAAVATGSRALCSRQEGSTSPAAGIRRRGTSPSSQCIAMVAPGRTEASRTWHGRAPTCTGAACPAGCWMVTTSTTADSRSSAAPAWRGRPGLAPECSDVQALNPYPSYRESGVLSFGKVPENWEVRKLRHILRRASNRYRPELSLLSVVREKGVVVRDVSNRDENHNVVPDDLTNYKVVEKFQFAMNKMKAWQGSYGVSNHLGIVSPAYFVFDIQGVDVSYFHRAIRSKVYVSYFTRASDGVRIGQWDLSTSAMREIPFLVPPPSVQASIVRFLDHADRRIQRYIRAKEKLIALLEDQKQSRSSTKRSRARSTSAQANPTQPTSPPVSSGWGRCRRSGRYSVLGDVISLQVISLTAGYPFKSDNFTKSESDVRLLRGINVAPGTIEVG